MRMMKMKGIMVMAFLIAIPLVAAEEKDRRVLIKDMKDPKILALSEFAFAEYNKTAKTPLKFDRGVVGTTEEIAEGTRYWLILTATDRKDYEAYLLVNPSKRILKLLSFEYFNN